MSFDDDGEVKMSCYTFLNESLNSKMVAYAGMKVPQEESFKV